MFQKCRSLRLVQEAQENQKVMGHTPLKKLKSVQANLTLNSVLHIQLTSDRSFWEIDQYKRVIKRMEVGIAACDVVQEVWPERCVS